MIKGSLRFFGVGKCHPSGQNRVIIRAWEQHLAGFWEFTIRHHLCGKGNLVVHPSGQPFTEFFIHVLDNDNGNREIFRKHGEYLDQRIGPAG